LQVPTVFASYIPHIPSYF